MNKIIDGIMVTFPTKQEEEITKQDKEHAGKGFFVLGVIFILVVVYKIYTHGN